MLSGTQTVVGKNQNKNQSSNEVNGNRLVVLDVGLECKDHWNMKPNLKSVRLKDFAWDFDKMPKKMIVDFPTQDMEMCENKGWKNLMTIGMVLG